MVSVLFSSRHSDLRDPDFKKLHLHLGTLWNNFLGEIDLVTLTPAI